MTFIEFLGFIITMVAFLFLILKRAYDEKWRREHPEEYQQKVKQQEEALKEFLHALEIEQEEVKEEPPPPPIKKVAPPPQQIEEKPVLPPEQQIHAGAYKHGVVRPSRSKRLVNKLSSKKEMVILHEIFDKPNALKDDKRF